MKEKIQTLVRSVAEVVLDKNHEIELSVCCLLAGGHLLIEDVPGVGKTTLVQALGILSGLNSSRIQFTVDLLPADILGGQTFHPVDHKFHFHPGPIFRQLVLADELNRASPRTQGALLQAMEEGSVSIDGVTHTLPTPFFVIATQNPHQQMGTFPLPESQLDRFLMSLELKYASRETEIQLFQGTDPRRKMAQLKPLLSSGEFISMQEQVQSVHLSDKVARYVSAILETSRKWSTGDTPLSTRAGFSLVRAAKSWAFMQGRDFVKPEDVQVVLIPVLAHRLGGNHGLKRGHEWAAELRSQTAVPI